MNKIQLIILLFAIAVGNPLVTADETKSDLRGINGKQSPVSQSNSEPDKEATREKTGDDCQAPRGPTQEDLGAISKLVATLRDLKAREKIGSVIDNEASTAPPPTSPEDVYNTIVKLPVFKLADVISRMTHGFCADSPSGTTGLSAFRNACDAIRRAREAERVLSLPDSPDEAKALSLLAEAVRFEGLAAGGQCDFLNTDLSEQNQMDLASIGWEVANLTVYRLQRAKTDNKKAAVLLKQRILDLRKSLKKAKGLFKKLQYDSGFKILEGILGGGGGLVFSYADFENNIKNKLAGSEIVGYSYTISNSGQLAGYGEKGKARTANDPPETPHSHTKKMNIASLSKTITSVAMLRLLRETPGVDLDSVIEPYLPPDWDLFIASMQLNFRELMKQRSGMWGDQVASSTSFESMQNYLFLLTDGEGYQYENANLGIFRIVLPYLWGILPQTFGQDLDVITAAIYIYYVQTYLFEPIGIMDADCKDPNGDRTLQYTNNTVGFESYDPDDWTLVCGGGGWYMSAKDMANFLVNVRFNDNYLHPDDRAIMDSNYLGWMDASVYSSFSGDWGIYRGHGGDLFNSYAGKPKYSEIHTCHMNFPNGAQAVLFVNSPLVSVFGTPLEYQCKLLANAYDGAWTWNP